MGRDHSAPEYLLLMQVAQTGKSHAGSHPVFTVVLGTGKRLFGETTDTKRLQLSSIQRWSVTASPSTSHAHLKR
jgi:hypothetical protein